MSNILTNTVRNIVRNTTNQTLPRRDLDAPVQQPQSKHFYLLEHTTEPTYVGIKLPGSFQKH